MTNLTKYHANNDVVFKYLIAIIMARASTGAF